MALHSTTREAPKACGLAEQTALCQKNNGVHHIWETWGTAPALLSQNTNREFTLGRVSPPPLPILLGIWGLFLPALTMVGSCVGGAVEGATPTLTRGNLHLHLPYLPARCAGC